MKKRKQIYAEAPMLSSSIPTDHLACTIRCTHLEINTAAIIINIYTGKAINNNTSNWICLSSMTNFSDKHIHTLSACYNSYKKTWVSIFAMDYCMWCLSYLAFSSHRPIVCFFCYRQKLLKALHSPHSYLISPLTVAPSNILCGLLTLLFSQNYFWLSCRYIVWISAYAPKDGFSTN